jgi:hypothetical protein
MSKKKTTHLGAVNDVSGPSATKTMIPRKQNTYLASSRRSPHIIGVVLGFHLAMSDGGFVFQWADLQNARGYQIISDGDY